MVLTLKSLGKMLPNGGSSIVTALQNGKEILIVVANKGGKICVKEVSSKEEGRSYINDLFGGESKFCGSFSK